MDPTKGHPCEACGDPATWESSTPEAALRHSTRRQRFLCLPHGSLWSDFRSQGRGFSTPRGVNYRRWQEVFDEFLVEVANARRGGTGPGPRLTGG